MSPNKQTIERGIQQPTPKELKDKEKVTVTKSKQDVSKLPPRKSISATKSNLS